MAESRATAVADLLVAGRDLRDRLIQPMPAVDSPVQYELDSLGSLTPAVERLVATVDLWSMVASDQVYGLSLMVRDQRTVFSLFPVLRSVIEHSTRITFLLDTEAIANVRLARAGLDALRSADEMAKAASRMGGKGSPTHEEAKTTRVTLRAKIAEEFGTLVIDPLSLEGEELASPTRVVERFGERFGPSARLWSGVYDYFCSTANHPTLSGYEYFDKQAPAAGAQVAPEYLERLVRSALVPYMRALESYTTYMGWPVEAVWAYVDRVNDVLMPLPGETTPES